MEVRLRRLLLTCTAVLIYCNSALVWSQVPDMDELKEIESVIQPVVERVEFNEAKITEDNFKGWIQERGLYFPGDWASEYQPLLEMHDTNSKPLKGSLLFCKFGKGNFVYTGLSFFRQLPAGVIGAYNLFINLISAGKN